MISSEYGWTDDQVLGLRLARFRQVRDVIWERRREDLHRELEVREMELRTICSFVAGSAGNKDGVKAAARIKLFKRKPKLPSTESVMRLFGG